MLSDVAVDCSLKVDDPAEVAPLQPAPGQGGEEALDRVHPRGRGRGEVEDPAWVPSQPGPHLRVLVRAVVVQDHVDQFAGRHRRLDRVEEAQELLVAVTLHAAADHRTLQYIERGKQRRGAVADVVVGLGLGATWRDGSAWAGALESLDLALLVEREHDGVARRIHIEPDDVLDLLGEGRIVRALEAADPMRLEAMGIPDALDRAQGDPDGLRQGAAGPVGDLTGRFGAGEGEHLGDGVGGVRRLAGRTGLVAQEALDAFLGVALLPAPDGRPADARLLGDVEDAEAFGREQDDAGALDVLEGPPPIGDDGGQARQVGGAGDYADSLSHPSDSHTSRLP